LTLDTFSDTYIYIYMCVSQYRHEHTHTHTHTHINHSNLAPTLAKKSKNKEKFQNK
jgi:hypothetical protein